MDWNKAGSNRIRLADSSMTNNVFLNKTDRRKSKKSQKRSKERSRCEGLGRIWKLKCVCGTGTCKIGTAKRGRLVIAYIAAIKRPRSRRTYWRIKITPASGIRNDLFAHTLSPHNFQGTPRRIPEKKIGKTFSGCLYFIIIAGIPMLSCIIWLILHLNHYVNFIIIS